MNRNSAAISGSLLILGIGGLLTGVLAFFAPTVFFETFAAYTGEPNLHLMRDVGAAYLAAGGALTWAVFVPRWRAPLTAIAGVFLMLHALAHLFDLFSGEVPWSHLLADLAQVLVPAAVVCGLAVYFLIDRSDDLPPGAPTA